MKIKNTPKLLIMYLIKEFSYSLLIFFLIFFSIIVLSIYIEEIIFFRDKFDSENIFLKTFFLALIKTPTNLIAMSPFIILFASIFYFVRLMRNNEIIPISLGGLGSNFIILTPSIFSLLLGIIFICILTPLSSELSKYYEINKRNYAANENLIIISKNGLWVKEKTNNGFNIIRADIVKDQNFKKLNNVSIYKFNNNYKLTQRIDSEFAIVNQKKWILNNSKNLLADLQNQTKNVNKNEAYQTNVDLEKLKNFFVDASIYSLWNLNKEIQNLNERGYLGQNLVVQLNKYLTLPLLLFSMVIISTFFTIKLSYKFNNFIYIFFGILTGIFIYFMLDLSVAVGKSGKIPIVLSIWIPVILIMTLSIFSLIRNDD